jgi:hypothetical protein
MRQRGRRCVCAWISRRASRLGYPQQHGWSAVLAFGKPQVALPSPAPPRVSETYHFRGRKSRFGTFRRAHETSTGCCFASSFAIGSLRLVRRVVAVVPCQSHMWGTSHRRHTLEYSRGIQVVAMLHVLPGKATNGKLPTLEPGPIDICAFEPRLRRPTPTGRTVRAGCYMIARLQKLYGHARARAHTQTNMTRTRACISD